MADKVIEYHDDSTTTSTFVILAIFLIAIMLFFLFGGAALFANLFTMPSSTTPNTQTESNTSGSEGGSINLGVPDEINVNTQ